MLVQLIRSWVQAQQEVAEEDSYKDWVSWGLCGVTLMGRVINYTLGTRCSGKAFNKYLVL